MRKQYNIRKIFQSTVRETDIMLMRTPYHKGPNETRDFMRPIGELSFHFLSRAPQPIQNYLTLIKPCDNYVWYLLASSVVAISLTLMVVDLIFAKWKDTSTDGIFHQSKKYASLSFRTFDHKSNFFAGIIIGIGAIIDEAIMDQYICKTPCAGARKIIVCMWILFGFLITISYKSVLLANMTSIEYEKGIDSIEDMLNSNKPLMVISSMKVNFDTSAIQKVQELSERNKYYELVRGKVPEWILDGYEMSTVWFIIYHSLSSYTEHIQKIPSSCWDQEPVVTLAFGCQREHTKARKLTYLVDLHPFNSLLSAHCRQV